MELTSDQIAHDPGDERIEVIADINSLIVWRAAPDGTPLQACGVSEVLPEGAGHSSETWLLAVHPDDREQVRPVWRTAIGSGTIFQAFYRLRQPDGSFRWSHGCGVPLLNDDGSVREWIGTIADIDDKIKADRSPSEERTRLALACNHVGVWDMDVSSGELWFSDTAAEIIGRFPNRPLPEADVWLLIHPDDRAPLRARVEAARAVLNGRWEAQFRVVHAVTGDVLWVECSAQALSDDAGRRARVLGTIRDITARQERP
jgi:PAS domain S-box-containing protein